MSSRTVVVLVALVVLMLEVVLLIPRVLPTLLVMTPITRQCPACHATRSGSDSGRSADQIRSRYVSKSRGRKSTANSTVTIFPSSLRRHRLNSSILEITECMADAGMFLAYEAGLATEVVRRLNDGKNSSLTRWPRQCS